MARVQENNNTLNYKVPPHNLEAEKSVLGAILIDKEAITKALEFLDPSGSDFYSPYHTSLYKAMVDLFEENTPVDAVTLVNKFKGDKEGLLKGVGGISYIGELVEDTPTAANINYYINIVKEKATLRRLIETSTNIVTKAYGYTDSIDDFVDDAERSIFDVSRGKGKKSFYAMKEIIKDAFEAIEKLYARKDSITGVATGFTDLDKLTSGFQPSDLIIVAGRPSMGKTAFALNIAENVGVDLGKPVAVFSLEMSKEQLVQRLLASRAKVGLQKIRSGKLKEEDWAKLTTSVGTLYESPIYIDDTPNQSVLEIRAKARRWKNEVDIGMIIVDYLQLLRGKGTGQYSREQEISEISRNLKALAKELDIPVVALSQLSRRTESREDGRPMLSDLRESGAIEQDADVVMFVYRKSVYQPCECPREFCSCGTRKSAEIIVAKQRNGPTDDIHLTFMNEFTRFENQTVGDYSEAEIQGQWAED